MSVNSRMEVIQIPAGPLQTNAFLVSEGASKRALIIDAPPDSRAIIEHEVSERGLTPIALVITHSHWDHIGDTAAIRDRYNIPVLIHEMDRPVLENPSHEDVTGVKPDRIIGEGDVVELGQVTFDVYHTPGHCPGQISLYSEDDSVLFGGDTLFPDGYGRVDIAGASEEETVSTIKKLLDFPDDTVVYPGHGRSTTIGRERPWMTQVAEAGSLA